MIAARLWSSLLSMLLLASKTSPTDNGASWLTSCATGCSTPSSETWKASRGNPRTGFPRGSVTVTGISTTFTSTRISPPAPFGSGRLRGAMSTRAPVPDGSESAKDRRAP